MKVELTSGGRRFNQTHSQVCEVELLGEVEVEGVEVEGAMVPEQVKSKS